MKSDIIQYNKDNFSGLSARSKLIIYRLGGIEKALEYYRLRGTFVNQKNVGSSTSSELSLYLEKYLININSNIDIRLNINDNIIENIVELYNKLKTKCSVRSKNVLNKMESVVSINFTNDDWIFYIRKYFICNYNFLEIPKIGEKGLIEFNYLKESISNRVLEIGQDLSIENPFYINVNDQDINLQISESSIENIRVSTIEVYKTLKLKCCKRTQNVLDNIEPAELMNNSMENWISFIQMYFVENFDFMSIPKIGRKSLIEYNLIKESILIDISNNKINLSDNDLNNSHGNLVLEIYNLLDQVISMDRIIEILGNSKSPSFELLCNLIIINYRHGKKGEFVLNYFFNVSILSLRDLYEILNCTNERVRQINISINHKITKIYWPKLNNVFERFEKSNFFSNLFYTNFDLLDIVIEQDKEIFKPNLRLQKLGFSLMITEDYTDLIEELILFKSEFKSFDLENVQFYIRKDLHEGLDLHNFFKWIDAEIYNFEILDFNYDLRILISRFFKEHLIEFSNNIVEPLFQALQLIRKPNWEHKAHLIQRENRKKRKDTIVTICTDFLNTINQSVSSSDELLKAVNVTNIVVDKVELLYILNKNKSTFARIGNGQWTLNSGIFNNQMGGSIRDIIYNLLLKSDIPLHISEILNYFCQFRSISEVSVATNLKLADKSIFQFFNCSFYGLKTKKYNSYWYNLPKLKGTHLSEFNLNIVKKLNPHNVSNFLELKYGYPAIHIDYLLKHRYK